MSMVVVTTEDKRVVPGTSASKQIFKNPFARAWHHPPDKFLCPDKIVAVLL